MEGKLHHFLSGITLSSSRILNNIQYNIPEKRKRENTVVENEMYDYYIMQQ